MRCRWLVSGKVQGVGFRWFMGQAAANLPLVGWVANLPDGRVEVVAEGPESAIAALGLAATKGPKGARVESVEKSDPGPHVTFPNTFEMR